MSSIFNRKPDGSVKTILHPDDLSAKDLARPVIDDIMTDKDAQALQIDRAIADAIIAGHEIAKQLEHLKPITRCMVVKTLYEHGMANERKYFKILQKLGI